MVNVWYYHNVEDNIQNEILFVMPSIIKPCDFAMRYIYAKWLSHINTQIPGPWLFTYRMFEIFLNILQ